MDPTTALYTLLHVGNECECIDATLKDHSQSTNNVYAAR